MLQKDLVSIIMPMYNCKNYVVDSIGSVILQTYTNWELVVVDDCSIDSSYEIVNKLSKNESRIRLYQMPRNSGVTKVRNYALSLARGKYIAFLDSDDLWFPEKLYTQITFLREKSLFFTYSSYDAIDGKSHYINTRYSLPKITYADMLKSNRIGHLTGIYDVDYFGKVYFEEVGHEDYVMWLKLIKQIPFTLGLKESLAQYRVMSDSLSSNKFRVLGWQWYIYRKIEKLTLVQSSYYFIFYLYNALKKRRKLY